MNMLIVNPEKKKELAGFNKTGDPTRQLNAAPLPNGRAALNADLLEDCGPGQTWEHYRAFLETLPKENVSPNELQELQQS